MDVIIPTERDTIILEGQEWIAGDARAPKPHPSHIVALTSQAFTAGVQVTMDRQ